MNHDYSEIKSKLDIVEYIGRYAELESKSGEYRCSCIFHHEDTPSMYVNKEKQVFRCHGCGAGGDILTFIQKYHGVSFEEALEILVFESGEEVRSKPKILSEIEKFKPKNDMPTKGVRLMDNCMDEFPKSHHIEEWLSEGISETILEKYDVRYSRDKSQILFPIKDENGNIISVKCRNLIVSKKTPKYTYLNKIGNKDFLYNFNNSKKYILELSECIIVEGEKSVMKLESWGIHNSVAVSSHFLGEQECNMLIRTNFSFVVFAYDSDVCVGEIKKQIERLKHYKAIFYIPTNSISQKSAPCDFGFDVWRDLYDKRERII